jgi:hypothetical protein
MATSTSVATTTTGDERVQTIVFMRHGVAAHNFEGADLYSPSLFDPPLTLQGKMGAIQAGDKIRTWWKSNHPDLGSGNSMYLILTSPLTRCLQTAMHAFLPGDDYDHCGGGGWIPIFCVENLREACGKHYPDKRREKSVLKVSFCSLSYGRCLAYGMFQLCIYWISANVISLVYCRNVGGQWGFNLMNP